VKDIKLNYDADTKKIAECLIKVKRERNPKLTQSFILSVNALEVKDKKFVQAVADYKFPNFKKLHVENMEFIGEEEVEHFNKFFSSSFPYEVKQVYLHGAMDEQPSISKFMARTKESTVPLTHS
jgi:hypothetical protein